MLADGPGESVGTGLLQKVCRGGAEALGRPVGALVAGRRADFLALVDVASGDADADDPAAVVDRWVFAPAGVRLAATVTGGRRRGDT